jgi:hypothetical protein
MKNPTLVAAFCFAQLVFSSLLCTGQEKKPAKESWQRDYSQFLDTLHRFRERGEVPSKKLLVGKYEREEGFPITDGAGGWIDLSPAPKTVQGLVNTAFPRKKVSWEFVLALNPQMTPEPIKTLLLVPKLSKSEKHGRVVGICLPVTALKEKAKIQRGCKIRLEGVIGDFKQRMPLFGFTGVNVIYHLVSEDDEERTAFWIGMREAKLTLLEAIPDNNVSNRDE